MVMIGDLMVPDTFWWAFADDYVRGRVLATDMGWMAR